ncbi:MAG: SDR family NAD(P)-dependent oxidoreductase [Deltaproteobacteria bacterium]|nr:SDR family NAD(P)-dependent oxidoreductase [Deltaproteobacteria bacterium]
MKDFKDRVAVVTGGASGIGRAMAERFAAAGMKVVLADIEESALQQAEQEMRAAGATALGVLTDVAKAESVEALAQKTLEAFGGAHIVCNNAGVGGGFGPMWTQPVQNWEWAFGVNLWGVIHGIRTFTPIMLKQDTEGHIVNTASMAGLISSPFMSVYDVTKFAVVTISESLHMELAMQNAKVKVSVLCPGFVNTNIATSERNRPTALQVETPQFSEAEISFATVMFAGIASGTPPAEVADKVFVAVQNEQFYILPHPELLPVVRRRMEAILGQQNPPSVFDGSATPFAMPGNK